MSYQLYRNTTLGNTLQESLDELIQVILFFFQFRYYHFKMFSYNNLNYILNDFNYLLNKTYGINDKKKYLINIT